MVINSIEGGARVSSNVGENEEEGDLDGYGVPTTSYGMARLCDIDGALGFFEKGHPKVPLHLFILLYSGLVLSFLGVILRGEALYSFLSSLVHLKDEKEEEKDICVSVFGVPKELLTVKPEAYIPQCVSIGPYHHLRPQLFEIERYKVAAARRFEKTLTGYCTFESVVEEVKKYDWQIRNCYHKFLEYKEEAFSMAHGSGWIVRVRVLAVLRQTGGSHFFGGVIPGEATRQSF
ncbi:hypothetical protein SUGI_0719950 [Cryptomeria japonica]|nr:hypothetical protein SUGI_0719950 [Cryptomeria japonica]